MKKIKSMVQTMKKDKKTEENSEDIIVLKEETPKKFLSSEEVKRMEVYHADEATRKSEGEVFALKLQILEVNKKILEGQIALNAKDVALLRQDLLRVTDRHTTKRNQHRDFIENLTTKYGIKSKWGFDPDSGEIKED